MRERQRLSANLRSNPGQNLGAAKTQTFLTLYCRLMFDRLDHASFHDSGSIFQVHPLMAACRVAQLTQTFNNLSLIAINHHTAY
jgi:hypothetical protein